jgi:GNAT superfamily N-acetyltransferase
MSNAAVEVVEHTGPREELVWSFRLAEDSDAALAGYLHRGTVWVARTQDGAVVGHLQAVSDGAVWEVVNTAVAEDRRGEGIGRLLLDHVVSVAGRAGVRRLVLATATADIGNLRFYQRCGFRMERIVPDAFGPATGYPEPIDIDGIALRDQVWFGREL